MERVSAFCDILGWCWCLRKNPSLIGINTKTPIFCIMGPDSCGKTTLAKALKSKIRFKLIDLPSLMKKNFGDVVFDEDVITVLASAIDDIKYDVAGFVIDGFPQNLNQMRMFMKEIYEPRLLVYVTLNEDVYLGRTPIKKKKEAMEKFRQQSQLLNHVYYKFETKTLKVNTEVPPDLLVERIVAYLELYYGFKFENTNNYKQI